jgi:hypothetical protein
VGLRRHSIALLAAQARARAAREGGLLQLQVLVCVMLRSQAELQRCHLLLQASNVAVCLPS